MKRLLLLLPMLLALAGPALALEMLATEKQILLSDASAVVVGTVVGTGDIRKGGSSMQYGTLDIRIDEVVGGTTLQLKAGDVLPREVRVLNSAWADKLHELVVPPQWAELTNGALRFGFKSDTLTDEELRTATVGKQFFFVIHGRPDSDSGQLLAGVWPLWAGDWIRACWTGAACADQAPWHGAMGSDTLACVAGVLARQPNLSALHINPAGYVRFVYRDPQGRRVRALTFVQWKSGRHLMGAPLRDLADAPVLKTAPIRDAQGAAITGWNDDGNPLKAAIPVIASECNVPYAGE